VIRVFIIDDHAILRASLRLLLERQPDMTVCGEAATAQDGAEQAPRAEPHVMLVDVSLPDMSGIDLVRALRIQHPELVMAMLSGHAERSYVMHALAAGANGYVVKGNSPELLEAVRALSRGERFVSRELGDFGAAAPKG
jgi:DNA-binding NarL/FixJ family response regulator